MKHEAQSMKDRNELERLNKAIAKSGICSRRNADELIKAGRVKVNNKIVLDLSTRVSSTDRIQVNNRIIESKDFRYFLFYKPSGYITTVSDEFGRKTIYDLLPNNFTYLKPVGRLDRDTEGLLLLTNDGDYINQVLHPRHDVKKTYLVKVKDVLAKNEVNQVITKLSSGVILDGKKCIPDQIKQILFNEGTYRKHTIFEVVIHEGINRQIRRMFQLVGCPVAELRRTKIGNFPLGRLPKGKYKELSKREAYAIFNSKRKA